MATTLELVRAYYPAYDGVADATVEIFIDQAVLEIGNAVSAWGAFYQRAVVSLTAHALEMRARSAGATGGGGGSGMTVMGQALSIKTGDESLSVSNGAALVAGGYVNGSDKIYASTPGGQEYLRLRDRVISFCATTTG